MSEVIENGASAAADVLQATPSGALFAKGVLFLAAGLICTAVSSRFMMEATRAAAIEGARIGTLNA